MNDPEKVTVVTPDLDKPCDYCNEGNVARLGWHYLEDPEGVEGTWKVLCAKVKP